MSINLNSFPLLRHIDSPADLRKLTPEQLPELAKELREFLCQSLNVCGGHFGASLGTVELTIALHYIFNTPEDHLIWDVGHQAYGHKVLTGRRDQLHTIRRQHGLAPFPRREESPYDDFGVGHSSTSIGAALGMAIADQLAGEDHQAIAVIGDGAMTAGMAFEALNHAGSIHANLLVVLNDNNMSISENVGALSNYFVRILSGKTYSTLREGGKRVLSAMPSPLWELVKRTEAHVKGMIAPGTLFEELGFNYIGPIDGHDTETLVETLSNLRGRKGPQLLHVITKKGKGYPPAEAEQIKYHAVNPGFYTVPSPSSSGHSQSLPTYSNVFGEWLCDMAEIDSRLVGITPAMREGSDLVEFSKRFPTRYFDVGIAEQHSVTVAAGMACEGLKPVVAIYSSFLQRAYDQLIHDVALQNLPVLFALDRAGLVGADGPTHAGSFDLSFLRCIPNMIIMAPSDENETRQMLYTGFQQNQPVAVRYPRGVGPGIKIQKEMTAYPIGKAEIRREGKEILILAFGSMLAPSLSAGEVLNATVVNMRFVKPLDENLVKELALTHTLIVTVEENTILGGAGSAVNDCLLKSGMALPSILNLGLPDTFIDHGNHLQMLADCGLNTEGILKSIRNRLF